MPTRMLKVKSTIPYHLEQRLVTHWGYAVEKRLYHPDNCILLKKSILADKTPNDEGVKRTIRASINDNVIQLPAVLTDMQNGLTTWQRKQLEKRCDNVVSFFPDPYSVPQAVRARLKIIQQKLVPAEVAFVQNYMDENFPE